MSELTVIEATRALQQLVGTRAWQLILKPFMLEQIRLLTVELVEQPDYGPKDSDRRGQIKAWGIVLSLEAKTQQMAQNIAQLARESEPAQEEKVAQGTIYDRE